MDAKTKYSKVTLKDSLHMRYLHHVKKMSAVELRKRYTTYSLRSIQRHMVKARTDTNGDGRKRNGRLKSTMHVKRCTNASDVKRKYKPIAMEASIHLRYLHQDKKERGVDLCRKYPKYAPSSIYKHMKLPLGKCQPDRRKTNTGRPRVISERSRRRLKNELVKLRKENNGDFTLEDLRMASAVPDSVSISSVARVLHANGYAYRNKRRKGILTEGDTKMRLKFAKHAKRMLGADIWTKGISFYLDGAGFTHKVNPCQHAVRQGTKSWRKRSEGLSLYCTAAGKREGDGGRVAKFMVTIAYGKGVTLCEEYQATLNGASFADFIRTYFPPCFKNSINGEEQVFLQDGDPSQNSQIAMQALAEIGGKKFGIPPRSLDLNPIENVFHHVKRKLKKEAKRKEITKETYAEYVARVKKTMEETDIGYINNTISSMNKRIDMVIKARGHRIKY